MESILHTIALTMVPGVGPVTARNLISYCGGSQAVFAARKKELHRIPGVGEQTAINLLQQEVLEQAEQELSWIEQSGIRPLSYLDEDYPQRLRHFNDAPLVLYYKGVANLNHDRQVAVIGTRQPTAYGLSTCDALIDGLSEYGVHIISGLAYGIDAAAHRRALTRDMPTIGVLGHGLGMIYPAQHRKLAERMLAQGGLLTEYTLHTPPDREHFPMRNRIVAGLCDALIVVETGRKGGSMITAYYANDYNKDVFAVPGRLRDTTSQGSNLLIKSHRASLIESAADIAYIMRWEKSAQRSATQTQLFVELTEDEKLIVNLLRTHQVLGIDQLMHDSRLKGSTMAGILLNLECKGVIKTHPGKRYSLV